MGTKEQMKLCRDIKLQIKDMGYIKVPRFLTFKRYNSEGKERQMVELYLYLLENASYSSGHVMKGTTKIFVERGECCEQKREIMRALGLKRHELDRHLNVLKEEKLIVQERRGNCTIFRVVDYEEFCGPNAQYVTKPRPQQPLKRTGSRQEASAAAGERNQAMDELRKTLGGRCISMYADGDQQKKGGLQ